MSLFMVKSIIATAILTAGLVSLISMLSLMGKTERKSSPEFLRKLHKTSGIVFALLLLVNSYLGMRYWVITGDSLSTRAVFHGVLALGLLITFILKIAIIRFFKQFLKFAPVMGLIVFALCFVVFSASAAYFLLRTAFTPQEPTQTSTPPLPYSPGVIENGMALFNSQCASCHYADREESRNAPGLKNILKRDELPASKRPATVENILLQLKRPFRIMPAFPSLSEQESADLLAYLKSL
jgi:mono/diheme cytochrome c family protein